MGKCDNDVVAAVKQIALGNDLTVIPRDSQMGKCDTRDPLLFWLYALLAQLAVAPDF